MDTFTAEERRALQPYFTNLDGPVFALRHLPEVVKGALFARYSRSPKSLRRLFLDEFHETLAAADDAAAGVGVARADKLFERVFSEYGDDSVAQLGGAHLACEGASNVLTKILEWGRLMAYLEQSTRYIPYTAKADGRWRYHLPAELAGSPLEVDYVAALDRAFSVYAESIDKVEAHFRERYPRAPDDSPGVYKRTIRAKALDTLRGLLPAATQSNVGLFGTGQAFEALLLRLRAHELAEARDYADLMLTELRKVIPAFLERVDREDRGVAWSRYLRSTAESVRSTASELLVDCRETRESPEVTLTEYDPDGEAKIVAAALYAQSQLPDEQLLEIARRMTADDRRSLLTAYVGERANRRHKPGRAFERTSYRFDVLTDYGAFRDLQRHRLLSLEWQPLTTQHGYAIPDVLEEVGGGGVFREVMDRCAEVRGKIVDAGHAAVAPYVVPMAYRVRFYMHMNAREAMHVIELRTAPQGHAAYRRVCQQMHTLIDEQAGHHAVAAAMKYVDHSAVELERLEAERASERRRQVRP